MNYPHPKGCGLLFVSTDQLWKFPASRGRTGDSRRSGHSRGVCIFAMKRAAHPGNRQNHNWHRASGRSCWTYPSCARLPSNLSAGSRPYYIVYILDVNIHFYYIIVYGGIHLSGLKSGSFLPQISDKNINEANHD